MAQAEAPPIPFLKKAQNIHSLKLLMVFFFFMCACVLFVSFQATKGIEKGTGNCIRGKIEQLGAEQKLLGQMDRWEREPMRAR